jgi:hypothetical protein
MSKHIERTPPVIVPTKEELDRFFNAKDWPGLIGLIVSSEGYRTDALLLKYLVSAWYYSGAPDSYVKALEAVRLLEPIDPVHACGMAIDLILYCGPDIPLLKSYLSLRGSLPLSPMEKSWLSYKTGLCRLAEGDNAEAVRMMDEADVSLFYDLMRWEHHFWRNFAARAPGPESNEFHKANNILIRAKLDNSRDLAVEAEHEAVRLNYGDLEYLSRTFRLKYFNNQKEESRPDSLRPGTIVYSML